MTPILDSFRTIISASSEVAFFGDKYMDEGPMLLKPIEIFENDIRTNLIKWSVAPAVDKSQAKMYYETNKYWYEVSRLIDQSAVLVLRRFSKETNKETKTWVNVNSCQGNLGIGKEWLIGQMNKRVSHV